MAVSLNDLLKPITEEDALQTALDLLKGYGFSVTTWRDGDVAYSLVRLVAKLYSDATQVVADIAAMGFNDTAEADGLTLLSKSHYENDRTAAVTTRGVFRLTASATAPPATIDVSSLVFANTATQTASTVTFRNTSGGVLNPGATLDITVEAEVGGVASNLPNSTTLYMWTPLVGVTVTNPPNATTGTWITRAGVDGEGDPKLRDRNRSKWATLSYAAVDGAYKNWALAAVDSAGAAVGVTRVKVRSNNPFGPGTVDVVCATGAGPTSAGQNAQVLAYILGSDGTGRRPLNDVVTVNSATTKALSVSGTVKVKQTFQNITTAVVIQQTISTYFNELDIGGQIIGSDPSGLAVYSEIIQRVMDLPGVLQVSLTNPTGDVTLLETEIVSPSYGSLTVTYVP